MTSSLLCAVFVESLPLKIIRVGFPVSLVFSWNGEASVDNIKNFFSLCASFFRAGANPHLYTILSPQSWSTMNSAFLLFWLTKQK